MSSEASALFKFQALGSGSELHSGEIAAASLEEASTLLARRGLLITAAERLQSRGGAKAEMPAAAAATGLRSLSELLAADVPLDRALAVLVSMPTRHWDTARVEALRAEVRNGRRLAASMRAAGLALPPDALGIIASGEAAGMLSSAVAYAADLLEVRAARRRDLRSALSYPALVATFALIATGVMLFVVLPKFAQLLLETGVDVPRSTALVLWLGRTAQESLLPAVLVTVAVAMVLWPFWRTRSTLRHSLLEAIHRVPGVSRVLGALQAERTHTILASILEAGVPLGRAVQMCVESATGSLQQRRLESLAEALRNGERFSVAVERLGLATGASILLIRSGEESGQLPRMLRRVASNERDLADRWIRALARSLEPALIVVIGAVVGFVALAMLQAIYSVRPHV